MHIRGHALCVKSPRLTIIHITVGVVVTWLVSNPELLILKFHKRSRRIPRCLARSVMTLSKSASVPLSVSRQQNSGWSMKSVVIIGAWKAAHLFAKTWCICEDDKNICITWLVQHRRLGSATPWFGSVSFIRRRFRHVTTLSSWQSSSTSLHPPSPPFFLQDHQVCQMYS